MTRIQLKKPKVGLHALLDINIYYESYSNQFGIDLEANRAVRQRKSNTLNVLKQWYHKFSGEMSLRQIVPGYFIILAEKEKGRGRKERREKGSEEEKNASSQNIYVKIKSFRKTYRRISL